MTTFTLATAEALVNDSNEFPVDFDLAWQWLGYTRRDNAKRNLLNCGFTDGTDFLISEELDNRSTFSPRPKEIISLSVECLKSWAMMSGTEKGKQVRLYFIECERRLKALTSKPMTTIEYLAMQAQAMLQLEKQQQEQQRLLSEHNSRLESIEYHTSGYADYMSLKAFCNVSGIDITKFSPNITGKLLTKYSQEQGVEVKKIADARYGEINAYHVNILKAYFAI